MKTFRFLSLLLLVLVSTQISFATEPVEALARKAVSGDRCDRRTAGAWTGRSGGAEDAIRRRDQGAHRQPYCRPRRTMATNHSRA
jgi:hypothetical protein